MDSLMSTILNIESLRVNTPLRVMIVDDHELFRRGLRDLLDSTGNFRVVAEARSGRDAITQLEQTVVDLVLLDLYLPDTTGIAAIRQLCAGATPPKVVILSGTIDDTVLVEALLAGASGYLTKELLSVDMLQVLQGVQRGELALPAPLTSHVIHLLIQRNNTLEMLLTAHQKERTAYLSLHPADEIEKLPVTNGLQPALHRLTPKEYKVCQLLRRGLSNKQIAAELSISPYTVGKHVQHILRKLGVVNRIQVASYTSFEGGDPG